MTAAPKLTSQQRCDTVLKELGILSSPAAPDLSDIISYIAQNNGQLPALKNLFSAVAQKRQAPEPEKEAKAMEQRLRRAIFQAHVNIATMGSLDYTNPRFEELAPLYFDYNDIRNTMRLLENDEKPAISQVHINTKKFIHALYDTVYSR